MNSQILNINGSYSFKSTTSIISSHHSSSCSRSQLNIARNSETPSTTAFVSTSEYVQNTTIIKVDTASYTTVLVTAPARELESSPSKTNSKSDDDGHCNLNELKDYLIELKNTLDRIDTSALDRYPINSNNSSIIEENPTSFPSFENNTLNSMETPPTPEAPFPSSLAPSPETSPSAITIVKSNKSFIVKKTTNSLPSKPRYKKQHSKNFRKSIVDLYSYYNYEWKRFKCPGEDAHMQERWKVHKKLFNLK